MSESIDAGGTGIAGILEFLVSMRDQFSEPMEKAVGHVERLKSAFSELAVAGAEIFGGLEFLKGTVEPAMEFETAQLSLQRATGATEQQLREAQEQADRLSVTWGTNAEDITKLQDVLSRYTGSLEESMKATELGAKLTASTGMEAGAAAKVLGAALTDLRMPGQTAEQAMQTTADKIDVLLNKFPAAGVSASRMARDIAKTAATMRTFHLDINQSLGLLAELNRTGIAGERGSGAIFDQMISSLLKLDKKGVPAAQKYGIALYKLRDGTVDMIQTLAHASPEAMDKFAESVGMSGRAMTLLVRHLHDAWDAQQEFTKASNDGGAVQRDANKAIQTAEVNVRNFENAWKDLRVELGQALLPAITAVTGGIANLLKVVLEFLDTNEEFRKAFAIGTEVAALALTFAGLFSALRAGIFVVKALTAAMVANPWVAVITAIVVAAVEIYQNWEWIKKTWAEGVAWITEHGQWIEDDIRAVAAVIKGTFDSIVNLKWSDIMNPSQLELIRSVTTAVGEAFQFMGNAIKAVWVEIKAIVGDAVDWILNKVELMAKGIRAIVGAIGWVGNKIGAAANFVGSEFGKKDALSPDQLRLMGLPAPSAQPQGPRVTVVGPSSPLISGPGSPAVPGAAGSVNKNVTQTVNNNPSINITVTQTPATPGDISSAVQSGVGQANKSLSDLLAAQASDDARTGFADSRFSGIPQ